MEARFSDFDRQLHKIGRTYGDWKDIVIQTYLETQIIFKKLDSLAQLMSTQRQEIGDLLQSHAQEQTRVRESQKFATAQISDNLHTLDDQIEAINTLQRSLSGFVFFISPTRKARSDASNM